LHGQYKDQGVVVMGISVNEGGAERIRPFVGANNLNYPILIADTSVKTAYGGIGKLPSIFIIDQEGNIRKEYFKYQGKHILELDINKLRPPE
jgi:peroxiredoxin